MQDGPNPELRNETYQLSKPPRTPSEGLRQKLKWTHLSKQRDMFRLVLVHRCMNNRAPEYPGRSLNQTGNLDFEEHGDMISCISSQWKQSGEGDLSVFKQRGTGTTFQNTMFTFYLVHKSILNCYVDVLIHVCISVYAGLPGRPVTYDWWDISCYKIKFIYLSIYRSIYLSIYRSIYLSIYLSTYLSNNWRYCNSGVDLATLNPISVSLGSSQISIFSS